MGCKSCGQNSGPRPMFGGGPEKKNVVGNLLKAANDNPDKIGWFKDGISGLIKCVIGEKPYTDEEIQKNRDICRECPHSTKNEEGKITMKSQCMGPDPLKNGAACGCFILCKSQVGKCPIGKWTHLKVNGKDISKAEIDPII